MTAPGINPTAAPALSLAARALCDAIAAGRIPEREMAVEYAYEMIADGTETAAFDEAFRARGWEALGARDLHPYNTSDPSFPFGILVPEDEPKRPCAEATWFAQALLMPEALFEDECVFAGGDAVALALRFQVPLTAALGRMAELGIIGLDHWWVQSRIGRLDAQRAEAYRALVAAAVAERPDRLSKLAARRLAA